MTMIIGHSFHPLRLIRWLIQTVIVVDVLLLCDQECDSYLIRQSSFATTNNYGNRIVYNKPSSTVTKSQRNDSIEDNDETTTTRNKRIQQRVINEVKEFMSCASIVSETFVTSLFSNNNNQTNVDVSEIVKICDEIDSLKRIGLLKQQQQQQQQSSSSVLLMETLNVRPMALEYRRYELLVQLMKQNYNSYIATATFLCPNRIERTKLPNVQDVPYSAGTTSDGSSSIQQQQQQQENSNPLVENCQLENVQYKDSILDKVLLYIFRQLVTKHTNGITSAKNGIEGLLDQGRQFMLLPNQTSSAQHDMVYNTLKDLMTPILPPFYRIFMSGIVPSTIFGIQVHDNNDADQPKKQYGPWFYAPFLTTIVTPTFFQFLVGPSTMNRKKDGSYGGLLVTKCKFLQESNCKGLCYHQCKIPAQHFFETELGMSLHVVPNFVTQECQWNFDEQPLLAIEDDPYYPKGCITGCQSRTLLLQQQQAVSTPPPTTQSTSICM